MQNLEEQHQDVIVLYEDAAGVLQIQVRLEDETVWLNQAQMATLFQKDLRTVNEHITNLFEEGELAKDTVIRNFRITAKDQKLYNVRHYNLDVIISVGYRVKSHRGTQFRMWATQRLREYIVKGFAMDDARLAGGKTRSEYFEELLERVRAIRASEKNLYEKVRDIFAIMQNKFHFAITGFTAAELVVNRIDGTDEHFGMTAWKGERPTRQKQK
jgi:hypothetical protein